MLYRFSIKIFHHLFADGELNLNNLTYIPYSPRVDAQNPMSSSTFLFYAMHVNPLLVLITVKSNFRLILQRDLSGGINKIVVLKSNC